MRHSNISLTLALAASTALGTWTVAQNPRPTTQPVPGAPIPRPQPQPEPAPQPPAQTPRPGTPAQPPTPGAPTTAPTTQPRAAATTQPAMPANDAAADAALPKENHELHVALRHVTIARNALKDTKDGGSHRIAAKTELNLAMDHLYRALGQPSTIGDDDQKDAKSAYKPLVESPEDKALPKEQHELHVAARHVTIAREALKGSKDAGQHRAEAADQVDQALAHLQQALGQPGTAKGAEPDPKSPSAKTE